MLKPSECGPSLVPQRRLPASQPGYPFKVAPSFTGGGNPDGGGGKQAGLDGSPTAPSSGGC